MSLDREKIAAASLENRGGCILVNDIDHAIELANEYAPEHLCLAVENPSAYVMKVKNAGGVFLGEASPEAVGDYSAGPSHTMPTGGSARWSSPLGVSDFLKKIALVNVPDEDIESLAQAASVIARAEGPNRARPFRRAPAAGPLRRPMLDPLKFVREDFAEIGAYKPVKPLDVLAREIGVAEDELVKLDANENLYGAPPSVRAAIAAADLHIYPDPGQTALREALSEYLGVKPEQVVAGAGADDLIDMLIRLTLPESIVTAPPTFGMYDFLARISSSRIVEVPRAPGFALDVPAIAAAVDAGPRSSSSPRRTTRPATR